MNQTTLSPFMLSQLRSMGLLEGEQLADTFERIRRDPDIGPLLAQRYGVRIGIDGDRLFMRRDHAITTADGARPDHSTASAPIVDPVAALPGARPWGPNGEPVNPPEAGDDQRRCWTLLLESDGAGTQCRLHNGHDGECDFGGGVDSAAHALPQRIVVDQHGHYWRDFGDQTDELKAKGPMRAAHQKAKRALAALPAQREPASEDARHATPELDEKRLAEAIAAITGIGVQETEHGIEYDVEGAHRIAAEYARLAQRGDAVEAEREEQGR